MRRQPATYRIFAGTPCLLAVLCCFVITIGGCSDGSPAGINKSAGSAFLKENGKKPDVVSLPSGLQYKVLKKGTGKKPTRSDIVTVHYEGRLIDGTVFDASRQRGAPMETPVTRLISGWTEVLQLMPVGSIWEVYIPPDLAYGEFGTGDKIGPSATLVFQIELLAIRE